MHRVDILMKSGQWISVELETWKLERTVSGKSLFKWEPIEKLQYLDPDEIAVILNTPKRKSEWDD